jgi:RNA polymerase sigma-70 factor (ECF subfamily)
MNDHAHPGHHLSALMKAAQDGDGAAYRTLLGEVAPLIRRVVRYRHPHLPADDVEDLVQDVLLSVHSVRATYDYTRPFVPWLMAIVRNRIADAARRHARRAAREVTVAEYAETFVGPAANTVDETYRDAEALQQAVAGLPKGQRVAIELLKLREMSLKEAAVTSGMSVGALKVASHRATKALRVALKARE